jgi:ribose transport system ATP-binding protein
MKNKLLEMKNIVKEFPGVKPLDGVNFDLLPGEVHALLGENGAGKSTLLKILSGVHQKTSGEIYLEGKNVLIKSPRQAQTLGISMVHQELLGVQEMNVTQNLMLGHEKTKLNLIHWKEMHQKSKEVLSQLGINIDVKTPLKNVSIAQRQMIDIAKALLFKSKIIILDEPTSSLTNTEIDRLFSVIDNLRNQGVGIIYVSHRMEELFQISDRITVLKDGKIVDTVDSNKVTRDDLVRMMVGRDIKVLEHKSVPNTEKEYLRVEGLSNKKVNNINFSLYQGEIIGIAGLVGSGRTELAQAIFGLDKIESGNILVNGKQVRIKNPSDAISSGIGLIPEDRKSQGIVGVMPALSNFTLSTLDRFSKGPFLNVKKRKQTVQKGFKDLHVNPPHLDKPIKQFSGGNQQKIIIGRWLGAGSKVLIFDEPTRGIDVNAKSEIYDLMLKYAEQGNSIIMISSELPEILQMSNRILVMREGEIVKELSHHEATEEKVLHYAMGGK